MKRLLQILFIFCVHSQAFSQSIKKDSLPLNKTEVFSSGFIDIMNNGQVNASARLIKLYIGEPGKLSIPISFYGAVGAFAVIGVVLTPGVNLVVLAGIGASIATGSIIGVIPSP